FEFHGNSKYLVCLDCSAKFSIENIDLTSLPPLCIACGGVLKPDFVFFGEPIPQEAFFQSYKEARDSAVVLVIGTSGEVMPACAFPYSAKNNGAKIIEINTEPSAFTYSVSDVFIKKGAAEAMKILVHDMGFI
ncbi:RNA polymerase subunit sigma, partial [candidate division WOR-3 bacterium]|nr:RNA polymerase subunit sigma [candidate division WOR-3 bacterium]